MNSSINFIKQRIKEEKTEEWVSKDNWEKALIWQPIKTIYELLNESYKNETSITATATSKDNLCKNIIINYNLGADFQYCILKESVHDGTLYFTSRVVYKALEQLLSGKTYYKFNIPSNCDFTKEGDYFKYDFIYTIGDIVINRIFKGNNEEDIVAIPVKFEWIRNNN
jgi:hypothetical protein